MGVSGVRPYGVRPVSVRCPSDKKKGREIDSFKGNLSKSVKIQKYSAKSIVLRCFGSKNEQILCDTWFLFPIYLNYPRWFLFFVDFGLSIHDSGGVGQITFRGD